MTVLKTYARWFVTDLDDALPWFEHVLGRRADLRFAFEGAELAAVGDVLLIATEDHQTYRQGLGPLVVDDVEATIDDLVSRGATVVSTFSSPTGHGAYVRHGGLDVEYLQWNPDILARVLGPAA